MTLPGEPQRPSVGAQHPRSLQSPECNRLACGGSSSTPDHVRHPFAILATVEPHPVPTAVQQRRQKRICRGAIVKGAVVAIPQFRGSSASVAQPAEQRSATALDHVLIPEDVRRVQVGVKPPEEPVEDDELAPQHLGLPLQRPGHTAVELLPGRDTACQQSSTAFSNTEMSLNAGRGEEVNRVGVRGVECRTRGCIEEG